MRILLDECLPARLASLFVDDDVRTVRDMNWLGLSNGKLLAAANAEFDLFVTVDKNLVNQQKIEGLKLSIVVLRANSNKIEDLAPIIDRERHALSKIQPGQVLVFSQFPNDV